jgi:hypothetical protein
MRSKRSSVFLRDPHLTAARDPESRYTCVEVFTESVLADVLSKLVGTVLYSTSREELCSGWYPTVSQARVPPGRDGIAEMLIDPPEELGEDRDGSRVLGSCLQSDRVQLILRRRAKTPEYVRILGHTSLCL